MVEAVRLGAHVADGRWIIGLSVFAIRTRSLPRIVGWIGMAVGTVVAANLFLPALMNISFLTVPTWFVVAGAAVGRSRTVPAPGLVPVIAEA